MTVCRHRGALEPTLDNFGDIYYIEGLFERFDILFFSYLFSADDTSRIDSAIAPIRVLNMQV